LIVSFVWLLFRKAGVSNKFYGTTICNYRKGNSFSRGNTHTYFSGDYDISMHSYEERSKKVFMTGTLLVEHLALYYVIIWCDWVWFLAMNYSCLWYYCDYGLIVGFTLIVVVLRLLFWLSWVLVNELCCCLVELVN